MFCNFTFYILFIKNRKTENYINETKNLFLDARISSYRVKVRSVSNVFLQTFN
jgi:hypothetical protein